MKTAIELIAEERQRQIEVEGWTPEHDQYHAGGELANAAACYALAASWRKIYRPIVTDKTPPLLGAHTLMSGTMIWPWLPDWWKPTPNDRIRELVKAGALIAAEIERLQNL